MVALAYNVARLISVCVFPHKPIIFPFWKLHFSVSLATHTYTQTRLLFFRSMFGAQISKWFHLILHSYHMHDSIVNCYAIPNGLEWDHQLQIGMNTFVGIHTDTERQTIFHLEYSHFKIKTLRITIDETLHSYLKFCKKKNERICIRCRVWILSWHFFVSTLNERNEQVNRKTWGFHCKVFDSFRTIWKCSSLK